MIDVRGMTNINGFNSSWEWWTPINVCSVLRAEKGEVIECGIRLKWTSQVRNRDPGVIRVSFRGLSWTERKKDYMVRIVIRVLFVYMYVCVYVCEWICAYVECVWIYFLILSRKNFNHKNTYPRTSSAGQDVLTETE